MSKERGHVRKGDLTRAAILDVALDVASRDGLEGVTIGILADRLDMSKSGVFSHFGSREIGSGDGAWLPVYFWRRGVR